jgi:UDP-N-acetylmuramyl pentapeptide phosphotransferase/UDP-N-acetylglucosamine-1-phosphate transferase
MAWLLILLAGSGHWVAALLLPLYYLADASITLVRRLLAGERIWEAHRRHFYQVATTRGFTVSGVIARVFVLNLLLAAMALIIVWQQSPGLRAAALAFGGALVAGLLWVFERGRPTAQAEKA